MGTGRDLRFLLVGVCGAIHGPTGTQPRPIPTCYSLARLRQRPPNPPAGATGAARRLYVGLGLVNVPRSMHSGGVDVGMADGGVRLIKNSINVAVFQALSSAGGSENVSSDSY